MTKKKTGRRTGRQANIVGAASSAAGFGGLSGVAVNSGVSTVKTSAVTAPVKQSGMSTVGSGLQVSGSDKALTPAVTVGGGSSGSGNTGGTGSKVVSGGSSSGGSSGSGSSSGGSVVTKPVVTQPAQPTVPTTPTTVVPKPTVPTGGSSSGSGNTGGSSSGSGGTIPVVVLEKPVSGSGGSDLPVETLPVVVIEKPVPGGITTGPAEPTQPVTPAVGGGSADTGKEETPIEAPSGFGDRFVVNPGVEDKIMFNKEEETKVEDMEKSMTPGFGGIEGLLETSGDDVEDGLDVGVETRPTTPGFDDKFHANIPEDGVYMPDVEKVTTGDPDVPAAKTPAKSGSGKKWLWLIVAAVALWFIVKKK